MKKIFNWQVMLGIILVGLSTIIYFIHFLIFGDADHIYIYLLGDIAFVPIEVLLVTLLIHRLLQQREKRSMLKKMNMVIGAFFSEVGTEVLRKIITFDETCSEFLIKKLNDMDNWNKKDFRDVREELKKRNYDINIEKGDLDDLKYFLSGRRDFLLRLLENPNLLEHEVFTELLWAVCHLTEELVFRDDLSVLPEPDRRHIAGDIKRVYRHLSGSWVDYMHHLKCDYPYLYSLSKRMNPFNEKSCAVIYE